MWKYPGRTIHIICVTLFSAWITSNIINSFSPYSYIIPRDDLNSVRINNTVN